MKYSLVFRKPVTAGKQDATVKQDAPGKQDESTPEDTKNEAPDQDESAPEDTKSEEPAPESTNDPANEAWRCPVCGYIFEGPLPEDFICPRCEQPGSVFERV